MKKRILIVDDEAGITESLSFFLDSEGYEVTTMRDGKGVRTLSRNAPDLILLDILLSGDDGREICKYLKSKDKTRSIPVILMSAHPNLGRTVEESGANDFLAKPFDIDELLRKILQHTNSL